MVHAETFLQMGREVLAIQVGAEKLCALAQGTIVKLAEAPDRTDSMDTR
ncbi:MAG: hypothetical protein V4569_18100 [Pseudomonadota bacterium]